MYTCARPLIFLLPLFAHVLLAQSSLTPSGFDSKDATITFTFDFPGSVPDHYALAIASSGQTNYTSRANSRANTAGDAGDGDSSSSSEQPFRYQFTVSEPTQAHIFDLAARANYFRGSLNYGKGKIANTGTKTLAYHDAQHNTETSFNYSPNPSVRELTALLQNIAATLEFGQRLDFEHRYQKLALDEELKRMEEAAKSYTIAEIQAIAPILKKIADDTSVVNVSRVRASRLLELGQREIHK